MNNKVPTKAVITAAGFGTRFLPQTKAMPKEMLPLVDKPIIQYVIEELVAAGIKDIIMVTSHNSSKRSIEDHFDYPSQDLINNLYAGGPKKGHLIEEVESIANLANFIYVRQKGSYGNARPLVNVRHLIDDEPFIYVFPDDLIISEPNCFKQMIDLYQEFNASIASCIPIDTDKQFGEYGVMGGAEVRPGLLKMDKIVEKPGRANAPSNFAHVGGYLFTSDIFDYLEVADKQLSEGEELYVAPVLQHMMNDGKPVYAAQIQNSRYYPTGDKLEYLKTVVEFALKRKDIGPAFREFLNGLER